ncbi:hypothetical protein [Haemophilus sp.]
MEFRKSVKSDIPEIMGIIKQAQDYFKEKNIDQWQNGYPNEEVINNDIENEESYVRNLSYPCYYEGKHDSENVPEGSTFTDVNYLPNILQPSSDTAQTNEIAEKTAVIKYNGFYIGRYETGIEDEKVVSRKSAKVCDYRTQEELKQLAKTMYNENNVKSAMCSGIQWDILMKFVDGKNDGMGNKYNVREGSTKRHRETSVEKTGNNLNDKVRNLYDLEGNCYEYVAEKNNSTNSYIARGGTFYTTAYSRASERPGGEGKGYQDTSFRATLYIM